MEQKARKLLIIGLGNIGPEFTGTRHNVGFCTVDFLAGEDAVWKKEKNYMVCKNDEIIFIKPLTFMNLSGLAVQAVMTKYKLPLESLIVIHDDIDLKLGDVRTKIGGGNAGHNGLKSISSSVGNEYKRIRIGVGRPENENLDIADWVLGHFTKDDMKVINSVIKNKIII
jgi:peptidyl-tRNA hydrolase, PTH1 family